MPARLKIWLALGFALAAAATGLAKNRDSPGQPLYNIVAVGRGPGKILLAALASPADKLQWRFREIPVLPSDSTVLDVQLSASGTKALVVFSDGTPRVFDLTERITGVSASSSPPPQHRLPEQRFAFSWNEQVCLVDDLGVRDKQGCTTAHAAAVHEDGRALLALEDGRLVVRSPDGSQKELAYRLPRDARFQLLAGHRGDAGDFLLLVNEAREKSGGENAIFRTRIVDPRQPDVPLGKFDNAIVAALRAQLLFDDPVAGGSGASPATGASDAALAILAARLDQESRPGEFVWTFYRAAVNAELYAPVLEFASGEPDYPSDVNIWEEIRQRAKGDSRQGYESAYASLGDRRWSRCTSYVRTLSYPGTWLVEYWFYFPFDEGNPHPHFHDSEHLFVEVDKLGGAVRNVFASDHDSFVPNNLFSTLVKDAPPVALPLYAMVELAKHAMAPDLNHDGRFTRGVDDNLHVEPYAFWGLRDRSKKIHVLMEPYRASMSVPRNREGRFALANAARLFPDLDVPAEHQVCRLQPFPDDPPCSNCEMATAAAGTNYLASHPDAKVPENIYKPYVVPWREVRLGVGIYDWSEGRAEISLSYVGDFRHMTGNLLRIPARLSLEAMWTPIGTSQPVRMAGQDPYLLSRSAWKVGVRIERLVTNTQGFYFGVTPKWVNISEREIDGAVSPSAPHWQYGGTSYHVGYVLELPSEHKGNFTNHVGVVIRNASPFPILFEWRVSFGFLQQRGRHNFGALPGDRNPYQ